MTVHVHRLEGCQPDSLGLYLKSLGVLRLVAEQADGEARGFWRDESFVLVTRLSREELVAFFAERYKPTPLVSPWNKGSGFMSDTDAALSPVRQSVGARFAPLREGIEAARSVVKQLAAADAAVRVIKDEAKAIKNAKEKATLRADANYKRRLATAERAFKAIKTDFIPACRKAWRGLHLQWLDAALVLDEGLQPRFPALLGTGGNDGRLDFTNNFYRRLGILFDLSSEEGGPRDGTAALLEAALFGEPTLGLEKGAVGQFLPGSAGGANSTTGPDGGAFLNTWDFVLGLEGAVLFSGSATQRLSTKVVRASAPFAVDARAAGYGSAGMSDEMPRGEQWMPLWREPWTLAAVRGVLAEGRCQVGARKSRDPIDLARSIARLGVARGIHAFERFSYIERNGQSNLAVPLGRWPVEPRPNAALLEDLDARSWLTQMRRAARNERAPRSLTAAVRRLDDAILAALAQGNRATHRWQEVLLALAHAEDRLVASGAFTAAKRLRPIPPLSLGWVAAVDDGSPEVHLALALANAGRSPHLATPGLKGRRERDPIRRHWLPLDKTGRAFATSERGLRQDPGVVCAGRDPLGDLLALVSRRIVEAKQRGLGAPSLAATRGWTARLGDLAAFVSGEVDVTRCMGLARAFMALDGSGRPARALPADEGPGDLWILLRLAHLTDPLEGREPIPIPLDPSIYRLLASGDGARGLQLAVRRLRASGLAPTIRGGVLHEERARLVAASLAFPVARAHARTWANDLMSTTESNDQKEPRHAR